MNTNKHYQRIMYENGNVKWLDIEWVYWCTIQNRSCRYMLLFRISFLFNLYQKNWTILYFASLFDKIQNIFFHESFKDHQTYSTYYHFQMLWCNVYELFNAFLFYLFINHTLGSCILYYMWRIFTIEENKCILNDIMKKIYCIFYTLNIFHYDNLTQFFIKNCNFKHSE